jgi:hypothetical protein
MERLPLVLSATALAIAVLGTTPLGAIAQNAAFPRNSVGSAQLQRNAVTAAKLAPNAVRAGHVLDGSLLAADFKPGQLPQGPKGDKGDKGERGEKGEPATRLWASVTHNGSIRDASGVTRVARIQTGRYFVDFGQPINKCALLATHGGLTTYTVGGVTILRYSDVSIGVATFEGSNSRDADFSVAAFC